MPSIKPISDLRNYTELLKQVTYGNRVYLTRNGKGEFALLTMEELVNTLKNRAKPGDVLLFKGSHGMHMERALQAFMQED